MDNDVFISFTHTDNQPWGPKQDCWISSFHESLETRMGQLLGRRPVIWRDLKLSGTDKFGDEILKQISKTRVLLSVVSPTYFASEWCTKERVAFLNTIKAAGQPAPLGNSSRICRAVKTHVPLEDQPEELTETLGFAFYRQEASGRFHEFKSYHESPLCSHYWLKLEELAFDLAHVIGKFEGTESQPQQRAADPKRTIYLAETASDVRGERQSIALELSEGRGFAVVPDHALPNDNTFRDTVEKHISGCRLSIHLVGAKYGAIPEDDEKSTVEIQHEIAANRATANRLSRLIWIPAAAEPVDARQAAFVERLEQHAPEDPAARLHRTEIEEFKTIIADTLAELDKPPQDPPRTERDPLWFYLICEGEDSAKANPVAEHLFDRGFEVKRSPVDGSGAVIRKLHYEYLRVCDVMFIFLCEDRQTWLDMKLIDLRKARGFDRQMPIRKKAVYLSGRPTPFKQGFRSHEVEVIKHFPDFSEEALRPMLESLQSNGGQGSG
ncbi:MAG TPA: DUF4062 domain-containing protein [Verrucomicrobiales bacterium]|nr:DUF4062 domain-containing protein [Verrucomicrobiales bacterium]